MNAFPFKLGCFFFVWYKMATEVETGYIWMTGPSAHLSYRSLYVGLWLSRQRRSLVNITYHYCSGFDLKEIASHWWFQAIMCLTALVCCSRICCTERGGYSRLLWHTIQRIPLLEYNLLTARVWMQRKKKTYEIINTLTNNFTTVQRFYNQFKKYIISSTILSSTLW